MNPAIGHENKHSYEFGAFRVDPAERVLARNGIRISLTPKAFDTLLILVQNSGHVLTKDELIKNLWPDSFVEENNLTQHISALRRALAEGPAEQEYIETVPRLGYRFVMPVRELVGHSETELLLQRRTRTHITLHEEEEEIAETDTETSEGRATKAELIGWLRELGAARQWIVVGCSVIAVALTAGGILYSRRSRPLTERDSILLADFENTTGEPAFDGALKQALAMKLEESPFLNVVSEQEVQETLSYMGRSPSEGLTATIAREACQRRGIKAMLAGSLTRLGDHYVVGLNAISCSSGDSLAREQVEAGSSERVLQATGEAALRLRAKLGESMASVQKFNAPIEQATTTSLEALRAFALGDELRQHGKESQAIPYYKRAIELDSNFAMAFARLAAVYANSGEFEIAGEQARKAFALRDRVSEREKFYISFHYYDKVEAGIGKQIETCELWRHTYPRDWYPYNALAALYSYGEHLEDAIAAGREAVHLNPNHSLPYNNLAYAYMCANQLGEAKTLCARAIASKLDGPDSEVHSFLFQIAFLENDAAGMQREVNWARGTPAEDDLLSVQSNALAELGKLNESRELVRRGKEMQLQRGFVENAALLQAAEAVTEAEFGNVRAAHTQVEAALAQTHSKVVLQNAALALARAGDTRRARTLLDELTKSWPNSADNFVPTIRAAIAIDRANPGKAIDWLRPLVTSPGSVAAYTRALAYLSARDNKEAASEFAKILQQRGVALFSAYPLFALSHLGLARAQSAMGDLRSSRRSYEQFLILWKDADPEIPILRQAQAEYAKLK